MSVGCRLNVTSTNSPGTSGAPPVSAPRFCGSAQPRVTTCDVLIVVDVQVTDGVKGSATSQTERFAAALLAAIRTLILGVPERCIGAVRVGVEYRSRCGPALTKLPGWHETSSTSFSVPWSGA